MAQLKQVNATGIEYKIQNNCLGKEIVMQLPCMRKEVEFCIYSFNKDSKYIWLQGDNKCLAINRETGIAKFSNKGSCPMDYYLIYKPTHEITFNKQIITDIEKALNVDSRYNLEDGTLTATICGK